MVAGIMMMIIITYLPSVATAKQPSGAPRTGSPVVNYHPDLATSDLEKKKKGLHT